MCSVLKDPANYGGEIADVSITASNGINGSVFRRLTFYLRQIDEVMVIYESKDLDDWLVIKNPSVIGPGTRFEAMDHGGAVWKLSTRHLVTSERAISASVEFIENEGVISNFEDWEHFPDDFI